MLKVTIKPQPGKHVNPDVQPGDVICLLIGKKPNSYYLVVDNPHGDKSNKPNFAFWSVELDGRDKFKVHWFSKAGEYIKVPAELTIGE